MIKTLKHFVVLLVIAIAIAVAYGFLIGGELSIFYYIFQTVTLGALALFFARYDLKEKFVEKFVEMSVMVGFIIFVSLVSYLSINQFSGELIAEYNTKVTDNYKGSVYFNDFKGNEQRVENGVEFFDFDMFIETGEYPCEGDTVHIKEYNGIFNVDYYVMESWENTNKYN